MFVYLYDHRISIAIDNRTFHLIDLSSTRQRNKIRVTLQQISRRHGVSPCKNVRRGRRTSYYKARLYSSVVLKRSRLGSRSRI